MTNATEPNSQAKISAAFAERLEHLAGNEVVQAIVLPVAQRSQAGSRRAEIEAVRREGEEHFYEIDDLLQSWGGQRLTHNPNTLGYIAVETTRPGVYAIANLNWVSAVVENQPIQGLPPNPP
ncbi:MAG: hypothetical protein HC802_19565 [Caldilineaceae bacterium]|nr:hypothetical protein [Caldilineaceae bacterium]